MMEMKMSQRKSVLVTSFLILLACTTFASALTSAAAKATITPPVTTQPLAERNRAVALRVFDEIFNQRRPEVATEIYSPNFRNHGLHSDASLEVDQGWARGELQAFPDLHMTVVKTVAEGDLVTILWIFRGTHARSGYGSFPPTGTFMEFRGITIFRIVDGRIVDEWTTFNQLSPYSQAFTHLRWWILAAVCLFLFGWLYFGHIVFRRFGRTRLQS
jgi:predicted ester cyclase